MHDQNVIYVGRPSNFLILQEVILLACSLTLVIVSSYILKHSFNFDINSKFETSYIILGLISVLFSFRILNAAHTIYSVKYILFDSVLLIEHGLFNIRRDTIELYRIKDISTFQSFIYRFCHLGDVIIYSTDLTHPTMTLKAIKDFTTLQSNLRSRIEKVRGNAVIESI